jgi:hypothetical protein
VGRPDKEEVMMEPITDHREAMDVLDAYVAKLHDEIEADVAEQFREARRLRPHGVTGAEVEGMIARTIVKTVVANWLGRP